MAWNWQLPEWPDFTYEPTQIAQYEKTFLLQTGQSAAYVTSLKGGERNQFIIDILSTEGLASSTIEGELLDRTSLQSSIKKYFGLVQDSQQIPLKEAGMAQALCDAYSSFDQPLSHDMLLSWHMSMFQSAKTLEQGAYRTHTEPMQIVSISAKAVRVHFEAPPSSQVPSNMEQFITWFNSSRTSIPVIARAAMAHVYFESIHPFEDGNGRIGRILVEKVLSQGVGAPILVSLSQYLARHKKEYYRVLESCNRSLALNSFMEFFAHALLAAQQDAGVSLSFLRYKAQLLATLEGTINNRQHKVLQRMFAAGPHGFVGGLTAHNYTALTKASKATVTRDLNDMVNKGALRKTGRGRYSRYWLCFERPYHV